MRKRLVAKNIGACRDGPDGVVPQEQKQMLDVIAQGHGAVVSAVALVDRMNIKNSWLAVLAEEHDVFMAALKLNDSFM